MVDKVKLGLIIFLFSHFVYAEQFYQWVDDKGVTHYSEFPRGAESNGYRAPETKKNNEEEQQNKPKKNYTNSTWQGCDSALCNKVKKFDPTCNSSDCTSAKKYTYDCEDIICKSKRINFEDRIDRKMERAIAREEKQKNKKSYSEQMSDLREEQQKASDQLVVDKCKRERDVFCDKSPEEIRNEYKYR